MKSTKTLLNLTTFFCFVYFVIYLFSIVFIPIAVYCFSAGKLFDYKANNLDDTMVVSNKQFYRYVIFVSIFCFPFGLLSIIAYKQLTSNNVMVSSVNTDNTENGISEATKTTIMEVYVEETKDEQKVEEPVKEETMEEKMEKFKKLQRFKENGFITEEELEQAREQLFGKNDN